MTTCANCGIKISGDAETCWACYLRLTKFRYIIGWSKKYNSMVLYSEELRTIYLIQDNAAASICSWAVDVDLSHGFEAIKEIRRTIGKNESDTAAFLPKLAKYCFQRIKNCPSYYLAEEKASEQNNQEPKNEPEILYHFKFFRKLKGNDFWWSKDTPITLRGGEKVIAKDIMEGDSIEVTNEDNNNEITIERIIRIEKREKNGDFQEISKNRFYLP